MRKVTTRRQDHTVAVMDGVGASAEPREGEQGGGDA